MELHQLSKPLPELITFYYYYSTSMLIITSIMTPILFFIIFTQSKKLGHFKWLIFNHSFWCTAMETGFCLIKPVFLTPACAGYQLGFFKDYGDFKTTAAFCGLALCFSTYSVLGLSLTLGSRYVISFKVEFKKYFYAKSTLLAIFGFHLMILIGTIIIVKAMFDTDRQEILIPASNYSTLLEDYFTETSFFYFDDAYHDHLDWIIISFFATLYSLAIFVLGYFIKASSKLRSKTFTTRLQKSLIFSSLIQIILTSFMLFLPLNLFIIFVKFDVPNSASVMMVLVCIMSTHCLLDSLATLYFVIPYKNYILRVFRALPNSIGDNSKSQSKPQRH